MDRGLDDADGGVLRAGTVVVRGRAVVEVTATGADGAMGRIAALLDHRRALTPLQHRLVGLGRWIAGLGAVLCLVVMVEGLVRGEPGELMAVTAVSLLVAAVPESLPAVVTLAFALGARRMTRRHAVLRRLPAVETLGSVTVVATDKTGTLTEGEMVVEALWTPSGEATVTGHGYAPDGQVLVDSGAVGPTSTAPDARAAVALLRAAALCCDARLAPGRSGPPGAGEPWTVIGDPTEGALLAAAAKVGLTREALEVALPRIGELPFDSGRRRMTTVHRAGGGAVLVVCKGAPDLLAPPFVRADEAQLARARGRAAAFAADGYRVLAVAAAHRRDPSGPWEHDLDLLGLVAIADPPRAAAGATVTAPRAAGILPVLVTGDHVATARAVALRLGSPTRPTRWSAVRRWWPAGRAAGRAPRCPTRTTSGCSPGRPRSRSCSSSRPGSAPGTSSP